MTQVRLNEKVKTKCQIKLRFLKSEYIIVPIELAANGQTNGKRDRKKTAQIKGGSPGLVVTWVNFYLKGREFKSQHWVVELRFENK